MNNILEQPDLRDTIIARQEIELERLRQQLKTMRNAVHDARKALEEASIALSNSIPYGQY
jgi:hypothetical protein